jgi:methylated-DNA-[protein]-cysteine S-methyltransferase
MKLSDPSEPCVVDRLDSPIGTMLMAVDARGALLALEWADAANRLSRRQEPGQAPPAVRRALEAYFEGDLVSLDVLRTCVRGTAFQRAVWASLRAIPAGTTVTYGAVAAAVGAPSAARAVGLASRDNPVAIVVPCHRVVGASGALTGYAGGLERKRWLLEHEARSIDSAQRARAGHEVAR